MAKVTYKVKSGDTLSGIAKAHNTTVAKLVSLNNIADPDFILAGETLIISGASSTSVTTSSATAAPKKVTVQRFGIQNGTTRKVYISWAFNRSYTDHYEVKWYYATGDGLWFVGTETTTTNKQSIYDAPENATKAKVKIKPVAKTKKKNGVDEFRWKGEWCKEQVQKFGPEPPPPPSQPDAPNVELKNLKLTASLENLNVNATHIRFRLYANDKPTAIKAESVAIVTKQAKITWDVKPGNRYKVRARSEKGDEKSEWSNYSQNYSTQPPAPGDFIEIKAVSESEVRLDWGNVSLATSYVVEYTKATKYFDSSPANVQSVEVQSVVGHAEVTGLEPGNEYYFRVKARNENGDSAWGPISKPIIVGKKPSPPTTWSSTTTAITTEKVTLFWTHNAEDGSDQKQAIVEINANGSNSEVVVNGDTMSHVLDMGTYSDGTTVKWRVKTRGILPDFSDWSVQRTIEVFAPATLEVSVTDKSGKDLDTLTSFPIYIVADAGPNTQKPLSYYVSVVANESYKTIDYLGNEQQIVKGQEVYKQYFDNSNDPLRVELSANNVNLDNNISYKIVSTVAMDSGLRAEDSRDFRVSWDDMTSAPDAEIALDYETYTATIRPYCEQYLYEYYRVLRDVDTDTYIVSSDQIYEIEGETPDDTPITTEGDVVYYSEERDLYFCIRISEEPVVVKGVTLSVYRRESDGSFTEISSGIDSESNTTVPDPHPALDVARYRIVAKTKDTGAVSFADISEPFGVTSVIVQWDEAWSEFNVTAGDVLEEPPWAGSLLKLPYNIDVSDSGKKDVELVEYIGRRHPVTYYGTHLGTTSVWNVDIEKDDADTLYGLRRLETWMGDVYVREPSGTGYWANISVSYSLKHCEMTIPVTLNITRVAGGI